MTFKGKLSENELVGTGPAIRLEPVLALEGGARSRT